MDTLRGFAGTPDDAVLRCRRSPNKYNELNRKALHGPDNFDVVCSLVHLLICSLTHGLIAT